MDKKYIIAFIAFIIYQLVNFLYFPLHTIYPDESRFISEAIKFGQSFQFYTGSERAWEMPLTAIIYGLFYKLIGTKVGLIIVIRIFQSLLVILNAFLIYKISEIIFKNKIQSLIAFIIMLFYPFFIYYQGLLLSETIFITILLIAFYFIYKWYESDFQLNKYFLLSNVFLILGLYFKATLSILPPFLISGFYFFNKFNLKFFLKIFIYSFLICLIVLSPWLIRNYIIFNKLIIFTTSSGANLYLGNNKNNKDGGCDWNKDVDKKLVVKIKKLSEIEQNKVFKEKALEFIKKHPHIFLRLAVMKLKRFYNIEFNNKNLRKSKLNYISIFSYGIIFILFLVSIILNRKNWRKLSVIYILFIYFTLLHMIVIASIRYRLPLEPFMILLASYTIYYFYKRVENVWHSRI